MSDSSAFVSAAFPSGVAHFFALAWKWSPWMNTGPPKPSAIAAPRTQAAYSPGRCSVYPISERAISKMNAPTPCRMAARKSARAVSYVSARMLNAGTVKARTSPRPMAIYRG